MATAIQDVAPVFSKLGPRISLFTPDEPAVGQLIIACTWLGAAKKHIAKYTMGHMKLAPKSRIILIESSVAILTSTYPVQQKAIQPAALTVRMVLEEVWNSETGTAAGETPPKIMIHTFSNGGTNSATQLLINLRAQLGRPVPLAGIICDSGPAVGEYWKSYNSMVLSLPKGFASPVIDPLIVHFILIVLFTSVACGRYELPETIIRTTLLNPAVVECERICYVFSKADRQVDWADVAGHAEEARTKGWQVKELLFEDTDHCNHISKHGAEYLEAVKCVWDGERLEARGSRL